MSDSFLTAILPQLAAGAAHTEALGFAFDGLHDGEPRIRVPWREDLVGDPDTGVFAGGLVTTLLDHIGGLAIWTALDAFQPVATVDLRVDYMRAARPHRDLLAQGVCYRMTHTIAFVRAWAFEDDPSDPVAAAQSAYIFNPSRQRPAGEAA
nr:PaaI family thioesterase [uncultured Brevundimonas sp.]